MIRLVGQLEMRLVPRPAMARRWWIVAFMVSLVMFSNVLLFLGEEAQAQELSEPVKQQSELVVEKAENTTQPVVDSAPEPVEQIAEPVKQAAEPVEQAVQSAAEPVVETVQTVVEPVGDTTQPVVDTVQPVVEKVKPVVEPVVDTVQPVVEPVEPLVDPVVETVQPVVEPVVETVQPVADAVAATSPIVDSAPLMTDPIIDALPEGDTMSVVQPVVDVTTPPQVDPAMLGQQPVPGTLSESTAATTPVVGTLQPANHPVAPSTSLPPVASSDLESASASVAGQSNLVAKTNSPVGLSSSSYGSVEVSNPYNNKGVSHSLLGSLLTALDPAGSEDLLNQALQQQPLSPGVPPASSGSSSSSSSGYGGNSDLLAILTLFSLLLLGGKGLQSMREFTKPSSALIPIIERPG